MTKAGSLGLAAELEPEFDGRAEPKGTHSLIVLDG
jgi:hypothetical protein